MYSSFANNSSSPITYYFTLGMLIVLPIALLIIGFINVRKENANERRAGYALLKLAGVVAAVVAIAFVWMYFSGGLSATPALLALL